MILIATIRAMVLSSSFQLLSTTSALSAAVHFKTPFYMGRVMSVRDDEAGGGGCGAVTAPTSQEALRLLIEGASLIPKEARPLTREDLAVIQVDAERRIKNARAIQHSLPEGVILDEAHMMRAALKDWGKHFEKHGLTCVTSNL